MHFLSHFPSNQTEPETDWPADGAPEDFRGGAEVNGAVGGFSVHALAEEPHVLHLLANKASGDAYLFAPQHHHLLPVQQLLRHYRRQPPKHMVPRVNHHPLRADPRTRHHCSLPRNPSLSLPASIGLALWFLLYSHRRDWKTRVFQLIMGRSNRTRFGFSLCLCGPILSWAQTKTDLRPGNVHIGLE